MTLPVRRTTNVESSTSSLSHRRATLDAAHRVPELTLLPQLHFNVAYITFAFLNEHPADTVLKEE